MVELCEKNGFEYVNMFFYNSYYQTFHKNKNPLNLISGQLIINFKKNGKKIAGYAATSKSTTVLNYCKIGTDIIDYICDTTDEKINKYSPGMHIPIVPIKHFRENIPDIAYLFAWNHKQEIFNKEKEFISKNGKWMSHVDL